MGPIQNQCAPSGQHQICLAVSLPKKVAPHSAVHRV
uniref:CPK5 n=1 Tax=Arundo donax TaxID=35708 RepID=A0A0A9E3T5_ARUDO